MPPQLPSHARHAEVRVAHHRGFLSRSIGSSNHLSPVPTVTFPRICSGDRKCQPQRQRYPIEAWTPVRRWRPPPASGAVGGSEASAKRQTAGDRRELAVPEHEVMVVGVVPAQLRDRAACWPWRPRWVPVPARWRPGSTTGGRHRRWTLIAAKFPGRTVPADPAATRHGRRAYLPTPSRAGGTADGRPRCRPRAPVGSR
jgi:hypothetical protein